MSSCKPTDSYRVGHADEDWSMNRNFVIGGTTLKLVHNIKRVFLSWCGFLMQERKDALKAEKETNDFTQSGQVLFESETRTKGWKLHGIYWNIVSAGWRRRRFHNWPVGERNADVAAHRQPDITHTLNNKVTHVKILTSNRFPAVSSSRCYLYISKRK